MSEIAVLGAGGPTGKQCVEKLLAQNKKVVAVVRDPAKYLGVWSSSKDLRIESGDVTNAASLAKALSSVKGFIFAASGKTYFSASSVDTEGVRNVAQVAKEKGLHVVLVSSALVTPKNRFSPIRLLLNNIRWGLMDAKFAGENALRESGASYTVVRPGGLNNGQAGQHKLVTGQRDTGKPGRISRADVAAVCVAALTNPKAKGVTLELWSDPSRPATPTNVNSLFDNLSPNIFD